MRPRIVAVLFKKGITLTLSKRVNKKIKFSTWNLTSSRAFGIVITLVEEGASVKKDFCIAHKKFSSKVRKLQQVFNSRYNKPNWELEIFFTSSVIGFPLFVYKETIAPFFEWFDEKRYNVYLGNLCFVLRKHTLRSNNEVLKQNF